MDGEEEWLSLTQAAELTHLSKAALAQLRYRGGGPIFYRLSGKTILYRRSQIIEWMEGCAFDRTDHRLVAG
ncbi:helix-turn-helix domain-containing protein [Microbacterium deminutum]